MTILNNFPVIWLFDFQKINIDNSNPKVHFSNDDFSTDIDFNVESRSLKTQYIKLENQTSDVVCHETPTFSVESRHEQTNAIELNEMVSTLKERSSTPKNLSCNVAFFDRMFNYR
ncbi:uncharacterized protein LOC124811557 [Hydra vulgaris]|uniref:uncharacterized protein LOC124811557 n=1 Tax=Hydra vulgaris TaxID=6087 RepID=UPI0032EA8560